MAKKTPESKEAAAERRQRELALLTSGVAAFSLMGGRPTPEATLVEPAETQPAPPAVPKAREPKVKKEGAQPAGPASPGKATAAAKKRVGEGPAVSPQPVTVSAAMTAEPEVEEEEEDDIEQSAPEADATVPAETSALDLARLVMPSNEKKGTTLRITTEHQQFFNNVGFLLGNGASAPDIIHNILTQFRADHEAQILKAMKKQMRHIMSPKK